MQYFYPATKARMEKLTIMCTTTPILLVCDQPVYAKLLALYLNDQPDFRVLEIYGNGTEAMARAQRCDFDLAVIDLLRSEPTGLELCRALHERFDDPHTVLLTDRMNRHLLEEAIEIGVAGSFSKSVTLDQFAEGLRRIASGEKVGHEHAHEWIKDGREIDQGNVLTPREREILRLFARGLSKRDIAARLHRSVFTIDNHIQNMMRKLDQHSRAELVRYAIAEGFVQACDQV